MLKTSPLLCKVLVLITSICQITAAHGISDLDSIKLLLLQENDTLEQLQHCMDLTNLYYHINRDSSTYYNNLALRKARQINNEFYLARCLANLATDFQEVGKNDSALILLDHADKLFLKNEDYAALTYSRATRGLVHQYSNDYEVAVDCYHQAIDYAKRSDQPQEIARMNYNIANIFLQNDFLEKAENYLLLTIETAGANLLYRAIGHAGLAELYLYHNLNIAAGIQRVDTVFTMIKDIGNIYLLNWFYRLKGAALDHQGKYKEAEEFYHKAVAKAAENNFDYDLSACYCEFAQNAINRNSLQEAREHFIKYENLHQDNRYLKSICLFRWASLEAKLGNHQRSNQLLFDHLRNFDSIYVRQKVAIINEIDAKYQNSRNRAEIAEQALVIAQRTSQRNLYLLALALSGSLLWFLYYRHRKNEKLQNEKIHNLERQHKILVMDSMLQGQEEERKRIAQDLHDGLGTLLAAARMQMQNVQIELDKLGNLKLVDKTEKLIDHACKEVRRISHDMMPNALTELGLIAAIEDLVDEIRLQKEMVLYLDLPVEIKELDNNTALNLYRIIQEILQNILKHAEANIVELSLKFGDTGIHLDIADDGIGFSGEEIQRGLGLSNIESRVSYLSGHVSLTSEPGQGCRYKINIPWPVASDNVTPVI